LRQHTCGSPDKEPHKVHHDRAKSNKEVASLVLENVAHGGQDQHREGNSLTPQKVQQARQETNTDEDSTSNQANHPRIGGSYETKHVIRNVSKNME
jgi:GTP cyclohydrolase I